LGPFGSIVVLPEHVLPQVIGRSGAIVVRPDRYVAAVANEPTELPALLARVLPTAP
jgi:hypothetical protein